MKTFLLAACAFCFAGTSATAQHLIEIAPVSLEKNIDIESKDCGTLNLTITSNRINEIAGLNADIYIPNGIGFNPEYIYKGDLLPYTSNKDGDRTYKHTVDFQAYASERQDIPGYTRYLLNIFSMSAETLSGESGESLVTFDLGTGDQDAFYPIYIKNVKLAISDQEALAEDLAATSYIKVGNPNNQSLAITGELTNLVNEALKNETAITNLDLSTVTKVNGTFTYVDGRAVTAPTGADVKADKAVYSRTVGAGNYASLKAPFTATGCSNLYTLDNNSDNLGSEWVNFTEAATIAAGDNLLVKGDIALSAENVALGHVDAAHKENDVYYVKNDLFYRGTNITINPLRTCWKLQGGNSNLMIAIDGEPTGITLNTIDGLNTPTYDLQGRRSEKAQHGIFVTNGKKQIIK